MLKSLRLDRKDEKTRPRQPSNAKPKRIGESGDGDDDGRQQPDYGLRSEEDGTYVVEFMTAAGHVLAISIPRTETAVIRHFQERMPDGLFVPENRA